MLLPKELFQHYRECVGVYFSKMLQPSWFENSATKKNVRFITLFAKKTSDKLQVKLFSRTSNKTVTKITSQ